MDETGVAQIGKTCALKRFGFVSVTRVNIAVLPIVQELRGVTTALCDAKQATATVAVSN